MSTSISSSTPARKGIEQRDPIEILDDLWEEMLKGEIYEVSLRSPEWVLDGLQVGQKVYIDPRPAILETLLHELLHRLRPRLSERTVERIASKLVTKMDEAMKVKWWKQYKRIVKKGVAVDVE